jgi:hypothetical protein
MEVLMAQTKIEEIPNIREEEGVFLSVKRRVWDKHELETQVPLVT